MTFDNDNDNDVNVYFRQALRAQLFIPAYFSVVLTGLNLFSHKFHKYTRILSVLIRANQWGNFSVFQILSFYISVPSEDAAV